MSQIADYWREVRQIEVTLPEWVWLMSLNDPMRGMVGGVVAQVGSAFAAKMLVQRSHRVATDQEVADYQKGEQRKRERAYIDKQREMGIGVFNLSSARGRK